MQQTFIKPYTEPKNKNPQDGVTRAPQTLTTKKTIAQFDEKEVVEAIKHMKADKSPGADNVTNEAIKTAHPQLALPLTALFNHILETTDTPSQWSQSNIILIYKKGDPRDIGNYRPISLLPCLYKLFSSLINQRISTTLDAEQPVEQAGFTSFPVILTLA